MTVKTSQRDLWQADGRIASKEGPGRWPTKLVTVKGMKRGRGRGQAHNDQTGPDETNLDRRELANGAANLDSEGARICVQAWVLGCEKLPPTATTSRHQPQDDWGFGHSFHMHSDSDFSK